MRIIVTEERECCTHKDMVEYRGLMNGEYKNPRVLKVWFCKHCGQLWKEDTYTDAAGSSSTGVRKIIPGIITDLWLR